MAIVKNKVKEYRNGVNTRSYTEIDVPASVAKSVGEGLNVIGGVIESQINKYYEKKAIKIQNNYDLLSDNIKFLEQFKGIDENFDKEIDYNNSRFSSLIKDSNLIVENGKVGLNDKLFSQRNFFVLIFVIIATIITYQMYGFGGVFFGFLFSAMIPLSYGGISDTLKLNSFIKESTNLISQMKSTNLFTISAEFGKVLGHYNSDFEKTKIYNGEITKEEHESNLINALKEVIVLNFKFDNSNHRFVNQKRKVIERNTYEESIKLKNILIKFVISYLFFVINDTLYNLISYGELNSLYFNIYDIIPAMVLTFLITKISFKEIVGKDINYSGLKIKSILIKFIISFLFFIFLQFVKSGSSIGSIIEHRFFYLITSSIFLTIIITIFSYINHKRKLKSLSNHDMINDIREVSDSNIENSEEKITGYQGLKQKNILTKVIISYVIITTLGFINFKMDGYSTEYFSLIKAFFPTLILSFIITLIITMFSFIVYKIKSKKQTAKS